MAKSLHVSNHGEKNVNIYCKIDFSLERWQVRVGESFLYWNVPLYPHPTTKKSSSFSVNAPFQDANLNSHNKAVIRIKCLVLFYLNLWMQEVRLLPHSQKVNDILALP